MLECLLAGVLTGVLTGDDQMQGEGLMTGVAESEIEFDCPGCAARLRVPASVAGREVRCPACDRLFQAPVKIAPFKVAPISAAPAVEPPAVEPPAVGPADVEPADVEPADVEPADVESPVVEPLTSPLDASPDDAQWWMRAPEGLNYGPATRATVERWVREGRVTGDCQLCTNVDPTWRAADSLFPALQPPPAGFSTSVVPRAESPRATTASSALAALAAGANAGPARSSHSSVPSSSLAAQLSPHRGPLILTLGLVGLLVQCPIFSVMAWVMGSSDLDEMARGRMDPSGASLTRSGRMLGLVLSFVWIIMAVASVASLIFYVAVRG